MNDNLCIFICSSLAAEVSHVLQNGNYSDVKLMIYPINCVGSPINNKSITSLVSKIKDQYSKIIFIVSSCHSTEKEEIKLDGNIEIFHLEQCFELILNKEIVYHYIKEGYYIVTNGWLKNYKQHIKEWGFDNKSAKLFFGESLKRILLLDTGITGEAETKLKSLSEYMDLPYDIIPVGLSHCRIFLDSIISRWRADVERKYITENLSKYSKESADYFFVFNQLENLINKTEESVIVREVFELLNILFSPEQISFKAESEGKENNVIRFNDKTIDFKRDENNFFSIEIIHQKEELGVFQIYGVKFPEYLEQYKKINLVISKVCGLSIANARKYKIISEQKEQIIIREYQFKNLSNQLESILDHIPGPVFYKDKENNFVKINKYFADAYRTSKKELEGKNLREFYTEEVAEEYYKDDLSVINSGISRLNIPESWETEEGMKWVSTSKIPFVDDNGEIIGVIGISFDITELKKVQDELKLERDKLEIAISEKDKFFSIIAHDLRSPFNAFLGLTELLVSDVNRFTIADLNKIATSLNRSANNLYTLLTNLLEWAKSQRDMTAFNPEKIYIKKIVEKIANIFIETTKDKNIDLKINIGEDITINADKPMMETILRNLISNAIKFTKSGGHVTISASKLKDKVEISVKDTGIGMNKNLINDLFRLDKQTNRKGTENEPSTGLGLLLCKDFVEKHNGKLIVESEVGDGSEFVVELGNRH